MKQHVTVVAYLNIGFGLLKLMVAGLVFLLVVGGGLLSRDPEAIAITSLVGMVVATFLVALALPGIVGGYGLLKGKPWARILILVLAVLDLIDFPIGTAISIYTIWVLISSETSSLFNGSAKNSKLAAAY